MDRCAPWLLCLAQLALATFVLAQEPLPSPTAVEGFEIERVTWVGRDAGGGGVTVVNRFGDVHARFGGDEGRVEVVANVQHFADEGPRLVVAATESAGGVEVTVGYRSEESGEWVTARDPAQRKRADLAVYVPRGSRLSAATGDGQIDARGLKSELRASTAGGDVSTREIDGELHVETGSGDVVAFLAEWSVAREHSFVSASGDLSIVLAGEADARVRVATGGLISTDVSMELDYQAGRRPSKRGAALLGKGSSVLELSSVDGHLRVIRRPLARKARMRPGTAAGDAAPRMPPSCDVTVGTGDVTTADGPLALGELPMPITVDAVTGDVTVRADPAVPASIHLATSGEITTDYTIAIDFRYHQEPAKYGHVAVAGGGATEVCLSRRRGAIRILRPAVEPGQAP